MEARRRRRVEEGASKVARRWRRVEGGVTKEARRKWRVVGGASMEARQFEGAKTMSPQWSLRIVASNWKRHSGNVNERTSSKERHRRSSNAGTSSKRQIGKHGHLK